MIDPQVLWVFFGSALLLALIPGPDNLFVMAQASQKGRLAGIIVTLGLCTGLLFHSSAVALGLSAIFHTSAIAFTVLKIVGAVYLLYLAYQAFRSSGQVSNASSVEKIEMGKLYRRGIIMNITNPKVSLFFLAFLPQFTNPQAGNFTLQIFLLGAIFILAALLVFGMISFLSGSLGEKFRRSESAQRWINRMAGTLFAGLAIKLALSER